MLQVGDFPKRRRKNSYSEPRSFQGTGDFSSGPSTSSDHQQPPQVLIIDNAYGSWVNELIKE